MESIANAVVLTGLVIFFFGGLWYLIESFRAGIWWGLGCVFIAPVQIIFLIAHWSAAKKPFGVQVLGVCLLFAGASLSDSEFIFRM